MHRRGWDAHLIREKDPKSERGKAQTRSYLGALIRILESINFPEAERAVRALGEAADTAAINSLASLAKASASLRAAALAALREIGASSAAAATQLAVVLMEKTQAEIGKEAGTPSGGSADRRRSPRVLLEIPVVVKWRDKKGEIRSELATTKVVNAYGALLTLKAPVWVGLELEMGNLNSRATAKARVVWVGNPTAEGSVELGIELSDPHPEFWAGEIPG